MPSVLGSNVTTAYARGILPILLASLLAASAWAGPCGDDSDRGLALFTQRVRDALAPIAPGTAAVRLEIVDRAAIQSAALSERHATIEQHKLRVLSWLGALPSRPQDPPVTLPTPRERAAWHDATNSRVLIAGKDGLDPRDEPEVFTTLAAAELLSLSTEPSGEDARRARRAVADALAQRLAWLELARFESGVNAALGRDSAFTTPGAALEELAERLSKTNAALDPWFRARDEFTTVHARDFIDRAIGFGGDEGLARVLRNPPRSSEQILHPEKYFDPAARDEPAAVAAFDLSTALGNDWSLFYRTQLGEYETGLLLRATGDPLRALKARRGFGGDEFRVYQHTATQELLLHWTIVLDPASAAEEPAARSANAIEFIDSLRKLLERRYANREPRVQTTLDENSVALVAIEPDSGRYHAQAYRWQDRVEFLLCDGVALDLEHMLSDHP